MSDSDKENTPEDDDDDDDDDRFTMLDRALDGGELDELALDKESADVHDYTVACPMYFTEHHLEPLSIGCNLLNNLKLLTNTRYPRGIPNVTWPQTCDPFLTSVQEQHDSLSCCFCEGVSFATKTISSEDREDHINLHLAVDKADLRIWSLVKFVGTLGTWGNLPNKQSRDTCWDIYRLLVNDGDCGGGDKWVKIAALADQLYAQIRSGAPNGIDRFISAACTSNFDLEQCLLCDTRCTKPKEMALHIKKAHGIADGVAARFTASVQLIGVLACVGVLPSVRIRMEAWKYLIVCQKIFASEFTDSKRKNKYKNKCKNKK